MELGLISVIVPVYNVEKYIERCLDSIVNQVYNNLEIILINDGSSDSSGAICENYAKKDPRIKVFHQANKGQSAARNLGLHIAKGNYIAFVDSDDWIEFSMFKTMIHFISEYQLEIVECKKITSLEKRNLDEKIQFRIDENPLPRILKGQIFEVFTRLYSKKIIQNEFFKEGKVFEDIFYTCRIVKKAGKIGYIDSPLYNYFVENESTIRSAYSLKRLHEIEGILEVKKLLEKEKDPGLQTIISKYLIQCCLNNYFSLIKQPNLDLEYKNKIYIKKLINKHHKIFLSKKLVYHNLAKLLSIRQFEIIMKLRNIF